MTRHDEARELRDRLHRAYCKPGETKPGVIFLTEVNAPEANRRADALALHLVRAKPWVDGIEIKVDRSDWLTELDDVTKADGWFGHTHRWWIAAADPSIVHPPELPDGWGLMVPDPRSPRRMKTLVKPTVRQPELTYPAVVEWLKKLDNQRAEEVTEQLQHVRDELRAEFDQRDQQRHHHDILDPASRQERDIGRALIEATGLPRRALHTALADPQTTALVQAALQPGADAVLDEQLRNRLLRDARRYQESANRLAAAASALDTDHNTAA